jgi:hypothetical protein
MPATHPTPSRRPAVVGAALALFAAGCASGKPDVATVTGKVVYKGTGEAATRLARGYVCLESVTDPNNKPVGEIEDDGTFFLGTVIEGTNLGGVRPGEYRARVVPPENDETGRLIPNLIDPRFTTFQKSGLRLTIAPGPQDITIEVDRPRR